VDGKLLTAQEIKQLASLPGKEELFSKLLYLINSPAQRLATVINATGKGLAVVVNQGIEKGKFGKPAAAPAAVEAPVAVAEAPAAEAAANPDVAAEAAAPEAAGEPVHAETPVEGA
jgi:large subunit ribosomal protein L10